MEKDLGLQCKLCRREGKKLFLKGERCYTPKCAIVKRNYPPGSHGTKTSKARPTEYGLQLREKQKAKRIYGLRERQFKNYYLKSIGKKGDTGELLFKALEMRLDNVIYRLGFAKSRAAARQMVSHSHILVNGRKVNIPSYQVRPGETIAIKDSSLNLAIFKNLGEELKNRELMSWLTLNNQNLQGKILTQPTKEDLREDFDVKLILEFYSR